MPAEAVIIENGVADLHDFNWTEYTDYFPATTEAYAELSTMLQEKVYGWKYRARLLKRADVCYKHYQGILQEIVASTETERAPRVPKVVSPVDGLRVYLSSLSDTHLETLSAEKNVSYTSFMRSNDRVGLIDAIVDEMVVV